MADVTQAPSGERDTAAYLAFALGIVSCGCGLFAGIPAIGLGIWARKDAGEGASTFAALGIGLGAITTLLTCLTLPIMMALSVLGQSLESNFEAVEGDLNFEAPALHAPR